MSVSHLAPVRVQADRGRLRLSKMGARAGAFDGSTTPIGSLFTWSESLKARVAICLHSAVQMAIYWQPEVSYFTCSYSPIHDHDGRVGGVLQVTQDGARRRVEERARHKGELRALLNDLRAHRSRRRRVSRKD